MEEMKVDFETFKEEIRGDIEKALYERSSTCDYEQILYQGLVRNVRAEYRFDKVSALFVV